ncbi:hypothetical protein [Rothia nasimurium]|uniref:hypothetical protein n=1 Tax=Rothia nasimurium TaxID=85336 RepID=UPI00366C9590
MPLSHPNGSGWIYLGSQGNDALKDGKISWYMGNTIYETDAQTGVTQELFEISAVKKVTRTLMQSSARTILWFSPEISMKRMTARMTLK